MAFVVFLLVGLRRPNGTTKAMHVPGQFLAKVLNNRNQMFHAPEPGRAADAAGASPGLGAIYPAKRYGLLTTQQCATFRRCWHLNIRGAPMVGRTRIAWHLPRAAVLHPAHARQRRS